MIEPPLDLGRQVLQGEVGGRKKEDWDETSATELRARIGRGRGRGRESNDNCEKAGDRQTHEGWAPGLYHQSAFSKRAQWSLALLSLVTHSTPVNAQ